MNKAVNLIFPHQLFYDSPLLNNGNEVYLIEEYLFFQQYRFHKQKIAFHRASMKQYQAYLEEKNIIVHYISSQDDRADIRSFYKEIEDKGIEEIFIVDPTDDWLTQRLKEVTQEINLVSYDNLQFINSPEDLSTFFRADKKTYFQTTFYKQQRKKLDILMLDGADPVGGSWTYDKENRKKYPKKKTPPAINFPAQSAFWDEAVTYTEQYFPGNPGELSQERYYPTTHKEAKDWFTQFLKIRFHEFGPYEDAIVSAHTFLNHSVLSPLLNAGLLLPLDVIHQSIAFAEQEDIPLNSTEGFVRQIIGWREFIRGMYMAKGRQARTCNFWNFKRKIPACFYDATTGIPPVDDAIQKVLQTGYCHHIERLMVLGNFMLLCEFDPDEVYRWFMELFIDAYDWVMVPNVYGMSQFADGGIFATKPYIGGANYIRKMSNYPKGDWESIWNGLYWRFIDRHQEFFLSNHRSSMMVHLLRKMSEEKKIKLFQSADQFIADKLEA